MKIPSARLDAFCRRPDAAIRAVLVYGPDAGLVRERAALLGRSAVPDPDDPFRVSVLTGAAVVADPPRLAEEAAALSLIGGRRLVRVREATDATAPALERVLRDGASGDTLIVVEAGELRAGSPLRKLFEGASAAAAVPCYVDEGAALERVLRETLAQYRVALDGEAAHWLAAHLGGDRGVLRGEAEKLALFVGDGGRVSVEDCIAVVGDSAEIAIDAVVAATAGGDRRRLERLLDRVFAEGEAPIRVLRALQRHFLRLLGLAAAVEAGARPQEAVDALRPKPHFKEAPLLAVQAQRWTRRRVAHAIARLADAEADCKRAAFPADLVCRRALDDLARLGERR
ncbi:DNA polymerase III subunit delta [Stella sp.]|uniref:DNA polymerase III subunit delta n=1 Tax=Stella sp. TaxID=2912054 RepID=UPI0035B2B345